MPNINGMVQFKFGLQTNYNNIEQKEANVVYFTTDTQRLFVGDTEYTRPVSHGTTLPANLLPPNSFFYHETEKALYFSKDGSTWVACSNFYTHPAFTALVVGTQTATDLTAGGTFVVPKITVNNQGHVSAAEDIVLTLPEETKNTATGTGEGNAVTGIEFSEDGHTLNFVKGETFATAEELSKVSDVANAAVVANEAITGGTATKITYDEKGLVVAGTTLEATDIPDLTLSKITDAGTAAGKDTATSAIIIDSTDAGLVTAAQVATFVKNQVAGLSGAMHFVGIVDELPATGNSGDVVILDHKEYVYNGTAWAELGDETIYAIKGEIVNADIAANANIDQSKISGLVDDLANKANKSDIPTELPNPEALTIGDKTYDGATAISVTKTDLGLGNVDNTADADKIVKSAGTLSTARTIALSGAVVGTATAFDGSQNITIATSAVDGAMVTGTVTSASQDGEGNVISETYATKEEAAAVGLVWTTF